MSCSQTLNIIGLSIDIVGVVLLYFYGIPPQVSKDGATYGRREQDDEEEKAKYKRFKLRSDVALLLILLGFVLQLLSTLFK